LTDRFFALVDIVSDVYLGEDIVFDFLLTRDQIAYQRGVLR
jgi:hypothetical protein